MPLFADVYIVDKLLYSWLGVIERASSRGLLMKLGETTCFPHENNLN